MPSFPGPFALTLFQCCVSCSRPAQLRHGGLGARAMLRNLGGSMEVHRSITLLLPRRSREQVDCLFPRFGFERPNQRSRAVFPSGPEHSLFDGYLRATPVPFSFPSN